MKKRAILAPAIVSLLTIAIAPQGKAETFVNPLSNGNLEVVTGQSCYVNFNSTGKLLRGGENCDDIDLSNARKAVEAYLQEQNGNDSENMNHETNASEAERMDDCTNVVSLKYKLQYNQVDVYMINDVMNWRLPNGRTGSCFFKEDGSVIIPAG